MDSIDGELGVFGTGHYGRNWCTVSDTLLHSDGWMGCGVGYCHAKTRYNTVKPYIYICDTIIPADKHKTAQRMCGCNRSLRW